MTDDEIMAIYHATYNRTATAGNPEWHKEVLTRFARAILAAAAPAAVPDDAKDAARYRALRDRRHSATPQVCDPIRPYVGYTPEQLDKALDKVITGQ